MTIHTPGNRNDNAAILTLITNTLASQQAVIDAAAVAVAAAGGIVSADVIVDDAVLPWRAGTVDSYGRMGEDGIGADGRLLPTTIESVRGRLSPAATIVYVDPSGTYTKQDGSTSVAYTHPKLANDAIVDASAAKPYEVWIAEGIYLGALPVSDPASVLEWEPKAYVKFIGTGRREQTVLKGELPLSVSDADMTATATIRVRQSSWLENLTITARNMRYPVHHESAGVVTDTTNVLHDCVLQHFGNDDVVAYRVANALPAGSPWVAVNAYGYGSASGVVIDSEGNTYISPKIPWGIHNDVQFSRPTVNRLKGDRLICTSVDTTTPPVALGPQGLGSGTRDHVIAENCELSGIVVQESDVPWLRTDAAGQYANHSEIKVTLRACSTIGFQTTNRGRALRVRSASAGATSSVRLTGTAAAVIVGTETDRDGGGGILGYAYGTLDISGIGVGSLGTTVVNNTLGKRLGDCSSVNKTLTMTFEDGSVVNHVFNANHTAQSNATILAAISATLGAHGSADAYLVSQGEIYMQVPDRQRTLLNASTSIGIPRWAAVKYDSASRNKIRLMTTADPASVFVGIAVVAIPPGKSGRVLTRGIMGLNQLLGATADADYGAILGGGTLAPGATLYHSDTLDGGFALTGTRAAGAGAWAPASPTVANPCWAAFNAAGAIT